MPDNRASVQPVKDAIFHEILGVAGKRNSRFASRFIRLILNIPVNRITSILVDFEQNVSTIGWNEAAKSLLSRFVSKVQVNGPIDIPTEGPLIVAANHPGSFDSIILAALIRRDDLMVMSSSMPFITCLPAVAPHFIFVGSSAHSKMAAFRSALRHLKDGKAILVFPRGNVEPDPALSPDAGRTLQFWSPSLGMLLSKTPQAKAVVSIVRGVISSRWFDSRLFQFLKKPEQRQKFAEIFQVAEQLTLSRQTSLEPVVSFSPPIAQYNPTLTGSEAWMSIILDHARQQVNQTRADDHLTTISFSNR